MLKIGTCSFSAPGWERSFYPAGMKPPERLAFYATRFSTLEIDSTFYATPAPQVVRNWYERTPDSFTFALKMPQIITHSKLLERCEPELDAFLISATRLEHKLGPVLLQFPYFGRDAFPTSAPFLDRLDRFLGLLPREIDFAIEVRNKWWIDERLLELSRAHRRPLAMIDHPWMHAPEILDGLLDVSKFSYIRLLGDRKGIEEITKSFHEEVVDRSPGIARWASIAARRSRAGETVHVYVNNHYSGYAPAAIEQFLRSYALQAEEATR